LTFSATDKVAYLTQTTLSVAEATAIIERLQERFPHIESPPKEDICYATTNRQEAINELAVKSDVVIVLGSQNSSNSRRLMELAASHGSDAYLVDSVDELQSEWFSDCETVMVTAGASAPEVVVQECVDHLVRAFGATVEEVVTREENVHFNLPRELRASS
jgi:4-hydroxy-3-methylbut-2-enyl diphosphate reductase